MPHYISYTTDIPGGHAHVHQHLRKQKQPTVIYNGTIMLKACFKFHIFNLESHESFLLRMYLLWLTNHDMEPQADQTESTLHKPR